MSKQLFAVVGLGVLIAACADTDAPTGLVDRHTNPAATQTALVATDSGGVLLRGTYKLGASLVGPSGVASCAPVPSGNLHWWTGDGSGEDIVGNHPGLLRNGVGFAPGLVTRGTGEAFLFDGVDDLVEVPDSPGLNPTVGFTVEAWARLDNITPGNSGAIVGKGHPFNESFGIDQFQGEWRSFIRTGVGGNPALRIHAGAVDVGVWVHLALSWDANQMAFYRDGVLVGTIALTTINNTSGVFMGIGSRSHQGQPPGQFIVEHEGPIEEVGYYDRALTGPEVAAIHAAGAAGKCAPESFTIISENATTATVEVSFTDANGDGQPPTLIGFRDGPTSSSRPAGANGAIACSPLFSPASPSTVVCNKDNANPVTIFAVVEGDGPERSIGSVTLQPAGGPPDLPPVASFTWTCDAQRFCTFDGSGSSDDNGITSYEWLVGGAVRATGVTVSNQFTETSTFALTLRVTDTAGQQSTQTQTVTVP